MIIVLGGKNSLMSNKYLVTMQGLYQQLRFAYYNLYCVGPSNIGNCRLKENNDDQLWG